MIRNTKRTLLRYLSGVLCASMLLGSIPVYATEDETISASNSSAIVMENDNAEIKADEEILEEQEKSDSEGTLEESNSSEDEETSEEPNTSEEVLEAQNILDIENLQEDAVSVKSSDGEIFYSSFEEAVTAIEEVSGETDVTLLQDITLSATTTIKTDGDLTLDLNGKTLLTNSKAFKFDVGGTVTIKDSTGANGTIEVTGSGNTWSAPKFIIESGNFVAGGTNRYISFKASSAPMAVEISGGTFTAKHTASNTNGVFNFVGSSAINNVTAVISNARVSSVGSGSSPAFSVGAYSGVTVNDGYFSASGKTQPVILNNASGMSDSKVEIHGGEFIATDTNGAVVCLNQAGYCAEIWIYDGKFDGKTACPFDMTEIKAQGETVGMEFNGGIYIRGGYFKGEISQSDTTGMSPVAIEDTESPYYGYVWYVKEQESYTAKVTLEGEGALLSPSGEISVVEGGEQTYTLTLQDDYTLTSVIYQLDGGQKTEVLDKLEQDGKTYTYTIQTEGSYSLTFKVEKVMSGENVATVIRSNGEETMYTLFSDAVAALEPGDTLKLLADVTRSDYIAINAGGKVTVDLNGHTIAVNSSATEQDPSLASVFVVQSGTLTLCDDSETGEGKIVGSRSGVSLRGSGNITFNLESGTIEAEEYGIFSGPFASNGKVDITGGTVTSSYIPVMMTSTNGELHISGGTITATGQATVDMGTNVAVSFNGKLLEIEGGVFTSYDAVLRLTNSKGKVSVTGGELLSVNGPGVYVYMQTGTTEIEIGGTAKIVSDNHSAVYLVDIAEQKIKITGNAVLDGKDYALNTRQATTFAGTIEGGYFLGEVLPIDYTVAITYADEMVMNVEPETEGAYSGYYTLIEKDLLAGLDENGLPQTYQNFDDLNNAISNAEAIDGSLYTELSYKEVVNALAVAKEVLNNKSANQKEIDYYTTPLVNAILGLVTLTEASLDDKADGTYKIAVTLLNASDNGGLSMANGAIDHTATLVLKDGIQTLQFTLNPLRAAGMWGHTENVWLYKGNSLSEAYSNARSENPELIPLDVLDWYVDENSTGEVVESDAQVEGAFPHTFSVKLPYFTLDEYKFLLRISIDVMNEIGVGEQSVLLQLDYGTMTAVEVTPTLSVDTEQIRLLPSTTQTVTAKMLGSSGWDFQWSTGSDDVVSVEGNGSTATVKGVSSGTDTVTVAAVKDGQTLATKSIPVTVVSGTGAVEPNVTVSSGTTTAQITGDAVVTNQEKVTLSKEQINIDVTGSNVASQVKVSMTQAAVQALSDMNLPLVLDTDLGILRLDASTLSQVTNNGDVALTMEKTSIPVFEDEDIDRSDFKAAYEIEMIASTSEITNLRGEVTITVPWSGRYGYAYYVEDGVLQDVQTMSVSNGMASWTTDHFSTWALSSKGNLMEQVGIKEGVYSVPIVIKQADQPSTDSMANDATGSMVVADVTDNGVTYTMFLKARVGTELGGDPLRGHLLKMWYYDPDDTDRENPISATVVRTYQDKDMYGEIDTFPREVEVWQEGEPQSQYYIMVSVDAMGADQYQDALVKLDWDNALDDGGEAAREGFEDEYATEQVIDSGDSVSRSDLKDWIDNECILLVQGRESDLTAYFDTDALEDIYGQTSSSVKFVLEELKKSKLSDEQQEVAGDRPIYQLKITSGSKTITEIDDGNVEVTFPYELEEDEVKEGLLIQLVDDDGDVQKIKCSYSTKGETVSFDTTNFGIFVIGYDADQIWENPFTDVKEEDWFYEAVKYVVQKGLFAGTSETTFEPNLTMTRSMLVTVLYRLAGSPEVEGSSKFSDVAPNAYYTDAVIWATQNGIVGGYDNGQFGTNDPVSREQMATILYRYAQHMEYDVSLVKGLNDYTDSNQVSSYAVRAMQWAVANGIINGTSSTTLSSQGSATRSQVAVILMRFDEEIAVPAEQQKEEGTKTK